MFFRDLETRRLQLINISEKDREFIFTHFSNDEVTRYLFDAEPLTDIGGADIIIDDYLQPEPRAQHRWILVTKDGGAKIGTCGFHCWDPLRGRCEVGYDLSPGAWGQGYMAEALEAILAFAKRDMKVKSIDACIYPENVKSARLVKKLGFVFEGQMKDEVFRGKRIPHRIYTLRFLDA